MMAGHPNDAKPDNLRNIGFGLFMGGKDGAYKRNQVAGQWKGLLADLRKGDPNGLRAHGPYLPGDGALDERKGC